MVDWKVKMNDMSDQSRRDAFLRRLRTPTNAEDCGPFKVRCGSCHAVLLSGWSEAALQRKPLDACHECGGTSAYASLKDDDAPKNR